MGGPHSDRGLLENRTLSTFEERLSRWALCYQDDPPARRVIADEGARVERIVAVVDREQGARENIETAGFTFDALYTSTDLGIGAPDG